MKKRIILGLLFIIVAAAAMAVPSIAASASSTEVYNWSQLRSALENSTTTDIRLMSDISVGYGGAVINPDKASLTIDGYTGFLTEPYKIIGYDSLSTGDTLRLMRRSRLTEITFSNVFIEGTNMYGLVYNNGLPVTINFERVIHSGPQLAYWPNGDVNIRNSLIYIIPGRNYSGGEAVRALNLTFGGLFVNMYKVHPINACDLFEIDNRGSITVAPNTVVTIENNRVPIEDIRREFPDIPSYYLNYTMYSGFVYNRGANTFTVGRNATFSYEGNNYFQAGTRFGAVTFEEGSVVDIKTYGRTPDLGVINISGSMYVGRNSSVVVESLKNDNCYPVINLNGNMTVDSPRYFRVQHSATYRSYSLAIGAAYTTGTFSFNDINSLRYGYSSGGTALWSNSSGAAFSTSVTMRDERVTAASSAGLSSGSAYTTSTASLTGTNLVEVVGNRAKITYRYVDNDLPGNPQLPGATYNDVEVYVSVGDTVDPRNPLYFKGETIYRTGSTRVDYQLASISPPASFRATGDTVVTYYYRKAFYANIHYVDIRAPGWPRADLAAPMEVMVLRNDTFLVTDAHAAIIPGYRLATTLPFTSGPITADGDRIEIEYTGEVEVNVIYYNNDKLPSEEGYVIREIATGDSVMPGTRYEYPVPPSDRMFTVPHPSGREVLEKDYRLLGPDLVVVPSMPDDGLVYVPFQHVLRVYLEYYELKMGPSYVVHGPIRVPGEEVNYSRTPVTYHLILPDDLKTFYVGTQKYRSLVDEVFKDPRFEPDAFENNLVLLVPSIKVFTYQAYFLDINSPTSPPFYVYEIEFDDGMRGLLDVSRLLVPAGPYGYFTEAGGKVWRHLEGALARDYGTILGPQPEPLYVYFTDVI